MKQTDIHADKIFHYFGKEAGAFIRTGTSVRINMVNSNSGNNDFKFNQE